MKKIVSVFLALVLVLSAVSALAGKSPNTNDVYQKTTAEEGKFTVDPDSKKAAELLDMLKESDSVDEFFGDVITADGSTATLSELLGSDDLVVNEFVGVSYEGPTDKLIKAAITVPSVYDKGEKVIVVIGIIDGEEVTWYAFEGKVESVDSNSSTIIVELTPELFKAMQDKECVIAIVSVNAE